MNPSFDSFPNDRTQYEGGNAGSWVPMSGVELIDCDDEPVSEAEIPEDPNRWTLPVIREGAAIALLVCVAPAIAACLAAAGTATLALLHPTIDE
jgi:hypothetical protein